MTPSLLERHLDEAMFLWSQRELASRAPHHDLQSLASVDRRLEANLDGLMLSGAAARQRALEEAADDAGARFAAACLALLEGDLSFFAEVCEGLTPGTPGTDAVAGALAWVPADRAKPALGRMIGPSAPPHLRTVGLAACCLRRLDPGETLDAALDAADPALRVAALEAAGVLGAERRCPKVQASLGHADPSVHAAAVFAGSLLGDIASRSVLPEVALSGPLARYEAAELCALLEAAGPARDLSGAPPRLAMRYAGASGDPRQVPSLLARLDDPEQARTAGEAFSMITGADLGRPPLLGYPPEGHVAGPNDDPADPNVQTDPDVDRPWPNAVAVRAWWPENANRLSAGGDRMLLGRPRAPAVLEEVVRGGRQGERAVAALALKIQREGRPLFNVRAPAPRQARALGIDV